MSRDFRFPACRLPVYRSSALVLLLLAIVPGARAEDQALRNRAIELLNRATLASRLPGALNIATEVTFSASINGGTAQTGSYKRTHGSNGDLREDIHFQQFESSMIDSHEDVAFIGPWYDLPYAVRALKRYIPYSPIHFDATDVIEAIQQSSVGGQRANCIEFVTVRGEDRNPGEICLSPTNATIIEWHDSRRSWTAVAYAPVEGALVPGSFIYKEGDSLLLTADIRYTLLDASPDAELTIPASWRKATYCSTYQPPAAVSAPQPANQGAPDSPVVDVQVHATVTAEGKVVDGQVLKTSRPELGPEAVRLVNTWLYQPELCDGKPIANVLDVTVHFQGR